MNTEMLKGKVAVVTGANSGVGRCISLRFAAEGAMVFGIARRIPELEKVKVEAEATGGIFEFCSGDITVQEEIDAIIDKVVEKFGRLDILVNCAGMLDFQYLCGDIESEHWDNVIALNLTAPLKTSRKALSYMLKQEEGGNIINIGSTATLNGCVGGAAYTASKHGLAGLTKNIATTYLNSNIRCNAVCPHGIRTPMISEEELSKCHPEGSEMTKRGADRAKRLSEPEEIANIVAFLASAESIAINGALIPADFGFSAF